MEPTIEQTIPGTVLKALGNLADRDEPRHALDCVCLQPDGWAVASDGRALVAVNNGHVTEDPILVRAAHARKASKREQVSIDRLGDLDAATGGDVLQKHGAFADWQKHLPETKPTHTVHLTARVAADFFRAMADIMDERGEAVVTVDLRFRKGEQHPRPLVVRSLKEEVLGLLMPVIPAKEDG